MLPQADCIDTRPTISFKGKYLLVYITYSIISVQSKLTYLNTEIIFSLGNQQ